MGAAVGANLILLALDISWDRSKRSRFLAGGGLSAPTQGTDEAEQELQPVAVDRS